MVVVGGGVIGLGIAWRVAQAGPSVAVVDDARRERASWAAAGLLAPVGEVDGGAAGHEALVELNLRSARRYPSFVAELEAAAGMSVAYRPGGSLVVAGDAAGEATLDELFRYQRDHGLDATRLTTEQCRSAEPALAAGLAGGLLVADDRQVENRRFEEALRRAGRAAGVELIAGRVDGLELGGGRVTGVRLADGTALAARTVVLAAGCWSGNVDGLPAGVLPPARPLKGQILRLRTDPAAPLIGRNVRGLLPETSIYLIPRADGELVVGATVEECGFETSVTAGAVHELLGAGRALVPDLDRAELVECWAGLRPGSPDDAPLLGPSALDGLVIATGHGRQGILLTPVTADAIAEVVTGGGVPAHLAAFRPSRFADTASSIAAHA